MALITNLDSIPAPAHVDERRIHHASVASFARGANTTEYGAGDALSTTVPGAIVFPYCARKAGGSGLILHATLAIAEHQGTAPELDLLFFDAEPTNFADNAALALADSDIEKWVGTLNFTAANCYKFGSGATGQMLYVSALEFPKPYKCAASDTALYGLISTAAFTPGENSAKVFIRLGLEMD